VADGPDMSFGVASALRTVVVAVLLVAAAGCADPNFKANGEDARRIGLLKGDEMYNYLLQRATCQDALARYVPSSGHLLDFAGISENRVICQLPNRAIAELFVAAEAAGWTPSVYVSNFEFRKKIGKLWASMEPATGDRAMTVTLALPEHSRKESGPGPSEIAEGRACLDAAKARTPPALSC
jgi:hypothetical protein